MSTAIWEGTPMSWSDSRWDDKDIVLELVKQNGLFLADAGASLKNDKKIVLEAIKQNPNAFRYATFKIQRDIDFVLLALKIDPNIFLILDPDIQQNPRIIKEESVQKFFQNEKKVKNTIIRKGDVILNFVSNITEDQLQNFKRDYHKATTKILSSKIEGFEKTLNGLITIGYREDFKGLHKSEETPDALYTSPFRGVFYFLNPNSSRISTYITLIHEYAHKFHDLYMINGFENEDIKKLYKEAKSGVCNLPKIGDPLSNLNLDPLKLSYDPKDTTTYPWNWTVRKANDKDYYLTKIENGLFIYTNMLNQEIRLDPKTISHMSNCPSQYSTKNKEEFFSEMCTLITLNLVKPSQKPMVDKFMEVVKKNLK